MPQEPLKVELPDVFGTPVHLDEVCTHCAGSGSEPGTQFACCLVCKSRSGMRPTVAGQAILDFIARYRW